MMEAGDRQWVWTEDLCYVTEEGEEVGLCWQRRVWCCGSYSVLCCLVPVGREREQEHNMWLNLHKEALTSEHELWALKVNYTLCVKLVSMFHASTHTIYIISATLISDFIAYITFCFTQVKVKKAVEEICLLESLLITRMTINALQRSSYSKQP